jgi:hypothetical protein
MNDLPPGHDLCKNPKVKSLPRGWHWCKQEQRVVTDTGIVVPIVDDPLIGTAEQRTALRRLREWEQHTDRQPWYQEVSNGQADNEPHAER